MAEYIEREALIREIKTAQEALQSDDDLLWELNKKYYAGLAWAHRIVLESPAADVAPKVNGRWVKQDDYSCCSNCGQAVADECCLWFKHCPNCGAKMDGDKHE